MKIAVYAICKNESKHVARFAESAKEADGVFVLDTGSTDSTVEELKKAGVNYGVQTFFPWRFDVARNAALSMVPLDYDACVILDIDEVLVPGWRPALEEHIKAGATRVQANYTWSFDDQGKPLLTFYMDRAHTRNGYQWKGACHETLRAIEGFEDKPIASDTFQIHHHPDPTKSRGQYMNLLVTACKEEPNNDRNCYYLAREYFNYGMLKEAVNEFLRHVQMDHGWHAERASSMAHLGICYQRLGDLHEAEKWHLRACGEDPDSRRNWLLLSQYYLDQKMWQEAYAMAKRAMRITSRAKVYLDMQSCWEGLPHDLAGTAAWYVGLKDESVNEMKAARAFDSSNARLNANIELCERMLKGVTS